MYGAAWPVSSLLPGKENPGDVYAGYTAYFFIFRIPSSSMVFPEQYIFEKEVGSGDGRFTLTLAEEDMSDIYPGMIRYTIRLFFQGREIAVFRTNTNEYTPTNPLDAKGAVLKKAAEWESGILGDRESFLTSLVQRRPPRQFDIPPAGVIILQGSPRADGNCSILIEWAVESALKSGEHARVIYPHDLDIRPCIGCYRCYNTGRCTFDDDMSPIITAVRSCRLLIICTPVYTNTVPGGLKLVIDRFQAYHAERCISEQVSGQKGLLFSIAGREGTEHFRCITQVVQPFFQNIGISPCGKILVDDADRIHDVRAIAGLREKVEAEVFQCLSGSTDLPDRNC
jgi:multimeric flavodoxin WrbA